MAQSSISTSQARAKAYGGLTEPVGKDLSISVEINANDGSNENLSGDELFFTLRRRGATRNALKKEIGDGITVDSEANGTATITLSHSDTKNLRPGYWDWQLWLKNSSGAYDLIGKGLIHFTKQHVTDPPTQTEVLEFVV